MIHQLTDRLQGAGIGVHRLSAADKQEIQIRELDDDMLEESEFKEELTPALTLESFADEDAEVEGFDFDDLELGGDLFDDNF